MSNWLWALVLLAGVWAAHWGAEHLAHPLKKLRRQWGFSVAAGGALIGIAAASPEIGINIASASTGVSNIGLDTMMGSNVIAIPLMVMVAYLATRNLKKKHQDKGHEQHLKEHLLKVDPTAVTVQALPYLVIVAVMALLTIPEQWRAATCRRLDYAGTLRPLSDSGPTSGKKGKRTGGMEKERGLVDCCRSRCFRPGSLLHCAGNRKYCGNPWDIQYYRRLVYYGSYGGFARGLCHLERG